MTKEEILQLDRIEEYREGNQLEAKAAQGGLPDTLWDSYSAFANTDGGCILLGVKERDDHSLYVVGLKDAEKMKKDFWNMVNNRQKISKNKDGFTFANPGSMRMAKTVAIGGGVSDPRNGTVLKIFSLINYGERAGSGLNSLSQVVTTCPKLVPSWTTLVL